MIETFYFGRHTIEYDGSGVGVVVYRGDVSAEEMRAMCDAPVDGEQGAAIALTLCDMREIGQMTPGARKVASARPRPAGKYFTAFVGVGLSMRIIVTMFQKATNLLQGDKNVVAFFDDRAPAKAWLLEQRRKMLEI